MKAKAVSPQKTTFSVELITIVRNRKTYGAAAVNVTILLGTIPGIAVVAGKEKWITNRDDAHAWLVERGLDADTALDLICAAEGDKAALKLFA